MRGKLYGVDALGRAFRWEDSAAAWVLEDTDDTWWNTAQVLANDGFWCWRRRGGKLELSIHKSPPNVRDWPIFVDGRFSFDVIRDIRIEGRALWMTTAGGVARYTLPGLDLEWLEPRATRPDGKPANLYDAGRFLPGTLPRVLAREGFYTLTGETWVWNPGKVEQETRISLTDEACNWQVEAAGGDGGILVKCLDRGNRLARPTRHLEAIEFDAIRAVFCEPRAVWFCTTSGLYRLRY